VRKALAVALLGLAAAGCTAAPSAGPATPERTGAVAAPRPAVPTPEHVVVVVLENKDVADVRDAPFLSALAARSADLTDAHAETHPSQPNYLALFSGDTHGVTDDRCVDLPGVPSLGGRLLAAGRTFIGYAEDLPEVGWTGCRQGGYARKHAPWVDFADVPPEASRPLSDLPADFAALPTVAFITPNLCHDMHSSSCGSDTTTEVKNGDSWLSTFLPKILASTQYQAGRTAVFITWDEDDFTSTQHIATLVIAPSVPAATTIATTFNHYSMLRTTEEMLGLSTVLGGAASASSMRESFGL
jgi:phosphatidylinositol-3-phosphatase